MWYYFLFFLKTAVKITTKIIAPMTIASKEEGFI